MVNPAPPPVGACQIGSQGNNQTVASCFRRPQTELTLQSFLSYLSARR